MTIEQRLRLSEGSDFPAAAGPISDRSIPFPPVVTALLGRFLPSLGPGNRSDARPVPFGGEGEPEGRHLRGPP
jgi:hypothetical protein